MRSGRTMTIGRRTEASILALAGVAALAKPHRELRAVALPESMPNNAPVSIAQVGPERFIFVDYRHLYVWQPGTSAVRVVVSIDPAVQLDTVWNPTGVHHADGRI